MGKVTREYRKLPGRGPGLVGVTKIWLHADHLLSVHRAFGLERYRRYFLRDIEALLIRRTATGFGWNCGLAGVAALLGAGGWALWLLKLSGAGYEFRPVAVTLWVLGGLLLLAVLLNALLGPTCSLFIKTGAGLEPLRAPLRLRPALRLVRQVAPLIEAAQNGDGARAGSQAPEVLTPAADVSVPAQPL